MLGFLKGRAYSVFWVYSSGGFIQCGGFLQGVRGVLCAGFIQGNQFIQGVGFIQWAGFT